MAAHQLPTDVLICSSNTTTSGVATGLKSSLFTITPCHALRLTCLLHMSNEWLEWECDRNHDPCNFQDTNSGTNLCSRAKNMGFSSFCFGTCGAVIVFTCPFLSKYLLLFHGSGIQCEDSASCYFYCNSTLWNLQNKYKMGSGILQTTSYKPEQEHLFVLYKPLYW